MTVLLEKAIARLRKLPSDRQDEAAELLMSMVEQDPAAIQLSASQIAEIEGRLGDASPSYASHAEVRSFFQKPAE